MTQTVGRSGGSSEPNHNPHWVKKKETRKGYRGGKKGMVVKVLVTTDNHVGYKETDTIRSEDGANTFREIMHLAVENNVDMVIQAGDLFHLNKPSKRSLYDVVNVLRDTVLGDKPVELEILSHGCLSLENKFNHVNYYDPNFNVAIPVFAISGNHDDAGGASMLAPMDVLGLAGLVNHFGRVLDHDNIVVEPILLQKGNTRIALYGLASVRDERLSRCFRDGKVRFQRPEDDGEGEWFSIMCVHQNHTMHSPTNHLSENYIPSFIDLVIWGHEHECVVDPRPNPITGFKVLLPGSSIVTSLCESEAKPKHVFLLDIERKSFSCTPIPLRSVRPFKFGTVVLSESGIPVSKNNEKHISAFLEKKVHEMLFDASLEWQESNPGYEESAQPLPLIRLRVDCSGGYEIGNPTRFSNKFVGSVANPTDVIQLVLRRETAQSQSKAKDSSQKLHPNELGAPLDSKIQLAQLVHAKLAQQRLKLLPEKGMDLAIMQQIEKDDKTAVKVFVDKVIVDRNIAVVEDLERMSIASEASLNTYSQTNLADGSSVVVDSEDEEMENATIRAQKTKVPSKRAAPTVAGARAKKVAANQTRTAPSSRALGSAPSMPAPESTGVPDSDDEFD